MPHSERALYSTDQRTVLLAEDVLEEGHLHVYELVPGMRVWTPEEDEMVKTLPAEEAERRTGRSLSAVYHRRHALMLLDGRRKDLAR